MPTINIHGGGSAGGSGGAGGPGGKQPFFHTTAEAAARMEYRLRALLSRDKHRNEEAALRREAQEQKKLEREKARLDNDYIRWWDRTLKDEERHRKRIDEERRRGERIFWRDTAVGGLLGAVTGGGGVYGLARFGGSIAGGAIAGKMGASAAGAGLAAEVVGEIAALLVNPMRAAYAAAQPYFNYQREAYGLGRAYGRSGAGVAGSFFPGAYQAAPWMRGLDITPQEAIQSLYQYGLAPTGSPAAMVQVMRRMSLTGGFNLMGGGAVENILRQGVGYGMAPGTAQGATGYLAPFAQVVQEAVSKGMDQSRLVESMQMSLETVAKMGVAGGSPSAIAGLIRQLMFTGTPGGLTGAAAAQAVGGTIGSLRGFMHTGPLSAALFGILPQYGNLKTPEDVRRFIGPKQWRAVETGRGSAYVNNIVTQVNRAASEGNYPAALDLIFQNLSGGNPQRMLQMLQPALQKMTGGRSYLYGITAGAMLPGVQRSTLDQLLYGGAAPSRVDEALMRYNAGGHWRGAGGYAQTVERIYHAGFGGAATGTFDSKIGVGGYIKRLTSAGVRADLAQMFASEGQRQGVNPMLLASIAAHESGGNQLGAIGTMAGAHFNRNGTYDLGIMQINSANFGRFPGAGVVGNARANIGAGAAILRGNLQHTGAVVSQTLDLPQRAVQARVTSAVGELTAAKEASATLVPVMQGLNDSMKRLTGSVNNLIRVMHGHPAARGTFPNFMISPLGAWPLP